MRFADVRMLEKLDDSMWVIMQFGVHDSPGFETRTEALQELFQEGFSFYAYFLNPNQELWVKGV